jgi:DNA-directed RNA polymerase specialized sigma24 family protein
MIDTKFSTRMDQLHNHGKKTAFTLAIRALEDLPFAQAKKFIQEQLEGCEDMEIALDRKLEQVS